MFVARMPLSEMPSRNHHHRTALVAAWLLCVAPPLALAGGACELAVVRRGTLYSYNLASPIPDHPHGVLSEDGFYKVALNETLLWFQLCGRMIFNHDLPRCYDCQGSSGHECTVIRVINSEKLPHRLIWMEIQLQQLHP